MQLVKEIMTKGVEAVNESATLQAAATAMRDKNIGFLVVGDGSSYIGCVTDRDLVVNGMAKGMDPRQNRVADVMTHSLMTCDQNAKVTEAVKLMRDQNVYRLVITDERDGPVGVVSFGDLSARSDEEVEIESALRQTARS